MLKLAQFLQPKQNFCSQNRISAAKTEFLQPKQTPVKCITSRTRQIGTAATPPATTLPPQNSISRRILGAPPSCGGGSSAGWCKLLIGRFPQGCGGGGGGPQDRELGGKGVGVGNHRVLAVNRHTAIVLDVRQLLLLAFGQ